ncbi:MAG: HAMP domain-containing histidine kinase [Deltaproteobacteria bacterium]|jgi:signal transduction histidine kinase|nr:HAMP domain-containing histidine kinase [Deltaproteobacteria bacterium]MBW2519956.1 HAMP domain-containing histidine kinase [Deltaproteobacteria bacterium]
MRWLRTVPKAWLITIGLLLVIFLGVLDTLTGQEVSFSAFYMLPIYLVTWYAGRWPGIVISLFSASTWLTADFASGHVASHSLIPFWNMLVRLTFFLVMTYLLSELQKNEQKRRSLERIFFHDILNLVGSLRGFAELLRSSQVPSPQEIYDLIYDAADKSLEGIEAQRVLTNAENNSINLEQNELNSRILITLLVNMYRHHEIARAKTIKISDDTELILFVSDQSLLSRVLSNMLKNALESTPIDGHVTIGCRLENRRVCFWVHNPAVIPEHIKKQIFKKRVSSKAGDRGLGTYSMKTLTDCLQGHISFISNPSQGTIFKACYPIKPPESHLPAPGNPHNS